VVNAAGVYAIHVKIVVFLRKPGETDLILSAAAIVDCARNQGHQSRKASAVHRQLLNLCALNHPPQFQATPDF